MRLALAAWCVFWAWIALPWRSFRPVPSFRNVEVLPFAGGSIRSHLLNVLVFVPFGILAARLGWRPRNVLLIAAGVSAVTEVFQLFSSRRYPSTTDVILNTLGAVIGLLVMRLATHAGRSTSSSTTVSADRTERA
jgi:glycopeptide antibiotics resistance protein